MRKSGTSARCTQMFGVPLEEVALTHTHAGYEVPLLVQHIVEYLHGRLDSEGVFLVNGNAERVDWLRQRYDSGEKVVLEKEADLASAVSLLRLFLQELPEPLITMEIQTHLLHIHQDYSSDEDICRNMKFVLQQLPQLSYNLLRFLCGFLARVASVQDDRWTVGSLASVFGPDLFHLWTEGEDIRDQEKVSRVLAELLDNQDGLFDSDDSDDDDDDDDEDASSTNDYSSFNEQEDERGGGGGEELPQDSEGMCEAAHQHTGESTQGCHGDEGGTEPEGSACGLDGETQLSQKEEYQHYLQDVESSCASLGDNSAMELDLLEAFSSDSQSFDSMDYTDMVSFGSSDCDQNANRTLLPCQPEIGHAAALHLFPGNQFEDPVPAYKSWQDDSDQGEAQLSPLAGRMLPLPALPLEEEAGDTSSSSSSSSSHHLLARRFLDFGAHGTRRFLLHEPDMFSKTHRPRRASFGSKEAMRGGDSATHQLTKKLQHLKKKMKQFEEQFERERNYKPSHGDKAANPKVLKWMTDLTKLRRQIKDARHRAESDPQTRPRSNTLPKSFGSTLDHDAPGEVKVHRPSREETLDLIQRRLGGKRQEDDWPEDIKKMTKEQLCCEKTVLQKNLLYYEGLHGRPVTKGERLVVRPLYDRYRLVKQMLTRITIAPVIVSPSSKRRGQILQPIIEGETAHFYDDVEEELRSEEDRGGSEVIMTLDPAPLTDRPITEQNNLLEEVSGKLEHRLSSCHASSMPELLEQLWKSRAEKKRLRQSIREFEEDFYQKYSRRVQKEERAALLDEYREYKRIKAKLRLLEVLISKQDSSKSI